jgi:CBS domain-containing protein
MLITALLGRPVRGSGGDLVGKLRDLVARLDDSSLPAITGIVVSTQGRRELFIPVDDVREIAETGVELATSRVDIRPFVRRDGELLLNRDLLDTKVIDLSRGRVARANDLAIEWNGQAWQVVAVDVSGAALAARVGLGRWFTRRRLLPWDQIDVFASQIPVGQPGVRHAKLAKLHAGDIAQIVDEVAAPQAKEILEAIDEARAADAVEDIDPRLAASVVGRLDAERAADLLEEMGDDAAADVLGDLEPDEAEEILDRMDPEDAEAVRSLLDFPDDSAGGLMTTEVVTMDPSVVAGVAIADLRAAEWAPDPLPAIYLVDGDGRLTGIVALRDLLLANPDTPLGAIGQPAPATIHPDEPADEAARLIGRYNLLALPVVDGDSILIGIVTIDDALDLIVERGKRRPGLFR